MIRTLFMIGIGGFIGSILRYLVQLFFDKPDGSLMPTATIVVNVLGSFLIGIFFAIGEKENWISNEWLLFLVIGLCGGFTTFSSFSFQNFELIKDNLIGYLLLNIVLSVVLGILAVYLGYWVVKLF